MVRTPEVPTAAEAPALLALAGVAGGLGLPAGSSAGRGVILMGNTAGTVATPPHCEQCSD